MSLGTLKWLAILLPLLFLAAIDRLRYLFFQARSHSVEGLLAYFAVLAVAVVLFSHVVFALFARLQGRILRQKDHLAALNSIAAVSAESAGLEPLLKTALSSILEALHADAGLVCTVDLDEGVHSAIAAQGFSPELAQRIHRVKLGDDPIAGKVVSTRRPVVIERLFEDPRVAEAAQHEGVRSSISVPLKAHGEVTGVLVIATQRERRFSAPDEELLASVGGQLGMAIRNATSLERLLLRNREMEALLTISRTMSSSPELPRVLDRALEAILEVTSAEAVEIWLAENGQLRLRRHRGTEPEPVSAATAISMDAGLPGVAIQTRSPIVVHNLPADARFLRAGIQAAEFQTYCTLPLLHRDRVLGVLGVAARAGDALSRPEELRLLEGISEIIGVAIENARLYETVQDAAVLEERERIAREMHDGLAQVLGYINTQTLAVRRLLAVGRTAEGREELSRMEDAVRQVYADVREGILGLRTSPHSQGGLLTSLQSYLEHYREMTGLQVLLEVSADADSQSVPPATEIQLMRVVQEALSNVRRHARAHKVTIRLFRAADVLRVTVQDDGRGFAPAALQPSGWPRFGLQTMRERAEAVGGAFQIESIPDGGTRVIVQVPLTHVEERVHASAAG